MTMSNATKIAASLAVATLLALGGAVSTATPADAMSVPGPGERAGCSIWRYGNDLRGKCQRSPGGAYFVEVTCRGFWGDYWVDWGHDAYAPGTASVGCGAFNKPIGGRLVRDPDWTTLARW